LGNPGPEYDWSPHNLGFLVVDRFAERHSVRVTRPECNALVGLGEWNGEALIVAKPLSYMNRSGGPVKQLLAKYANPDPPRLLLAYDELALPWGELRIRPKGSAGGHNGVISVIGSLGTDEFIRLRLGCSPGHPLAKGAGAEYLLTPLRRGQREALGEMLGQAAEAIESIIADGVEKSMTKYNRRAGAAEG
jgi:PTH1 family peptidyl-tRNA hydrolase